MTALLLTSLALVAGSCLIAAAASGFAPGAWAWGALGPVGWPIAFFLGAGHRKRRRTSSLYARRNLHRRAKRHAATR